MLMTSIKSEGRGRGGVRVRLRAVPRRPSARPPVRPVPKGGASGPRLTRSSAARGAAPPSLPPTRAAGALEFLRRTP